MKSTLTMKDHSVLIKQRNAQLLKSIKQHSNDEKAAAYIFFCERNYKLGLIKENETQLNQQRCGSAIQQADLTFKKALKLGWSDYQRAEVTQREEHKIAKASRDKAQLSVDAEYIDNLAANELDYKNKIAKIEYAYNHKVSAVNQAFQRISQKNTAKMKKLNSDNHLIISESNNSYQNTLNIAQQIVWQDKSAAQTLAKKALYAEGTKFEAALSENTVDSYRMVAKAIGLDDVTADIGSPGGSKTVYDVIQPLISFYDLRRALKEAHENDTDSQLIKNFYNVISDDPNVDITILKSYIELLDLTSDLNRFKHQYHFMPPPAVLERNILYIEILTGSIICTVLTPFGKILTKSYDADAIVEGITLKTAMQRGNLIDFIEQNAPKFLKNLYYNANWKDNAFSYLIQSVNGFKEHAIKTMVTSNRELARSNGFESVNLTTSHLHRSHDEACTLDTTPLYLLKQQHIGTKSEINEHYKTVCSEVDNRFKKTMAEAEQVREKKLGDYQKAYDAEEMDIEWDFLEAESLINIQTFTQVENSTAIEDKPNKPVKSNNSRFFNKASGKGKLPSINEDALYEEEELHEEGNWYDYFIWNID